MRWLPRSGWTQQEASVQSPKMPGHRAGLPPAISGPAPACPRKSVLPGMHGASHSAVHAQGLVYLKQLTGSGQLLQATHRVKQEYTHAHMCVYTMPCFQQQLHETRIIHTIHSESHGHYTECNTWPASLQSQVCDSTSYDIRCVCHILLFCISSDCYMHMISTYVSVYICPHLQHLQSRGQSRGSCDRHTTTLQPPAMSSRAWHL